MKVLGTPNRREELGLFLNREKLLGEGAEIGVAHGAFARSVLLDWSGKRYWMIDPWTSQDPAVYKEKQEEAWKYERWYEECIDIQLKDPRVLCLRGYSSRIVSQFEDNQLDWVYIDGNHDFEHVSEDIRLWYPKVRPGGLVSGHDCYNSTEGGHYCQVKDAVFKASLDMGWASYVVTDCSSWWHRKPSRFVPNAEEEARMAQ
jgi:methyltransferase family protein